MWTPAIKMTLLIDYHFNILVYNYTYTRVARSYTFIYPKLYTETMQNASYSVSLRICCKWMDAYRLGHKTYIPVAIWTVKKLKPIPCSMKYIHANIQFTYVTSISLSISLEESELHFY